MHASSIALLSGIVVGWIVALITIARRRHGLRQQDNASHPE